MEQLDQIKKQFESSILTTYQGIAPERLYEPIHYLLNIGGKRIRPVLLLQVFSLYKNDFDYAIGAAQAVELFHNFSLMHDDIMDAADLRRGQATVHKKYSENQAILSGDAMLIKSYQALNTYNDQDFYPELMKFYSEIALGICEGQQMDSDFETRDDVIISEYVKMIELKTAILFGAAMKMGAMLAGASADDQRHLYEFGKNLGIAFQLLDDHLDCYGDKQKVGKKKGGDIIQAKKTYLHLKTVELLEQNELEKYLTIFNATDLQESDKVTQVMQYYRDVNASGYLLEMKDAYTQLATSHLSAISLDPSIYQQLNDYLMLLAKRTS